MNLQLSKHRVLHINEFCLSAFVRTVTNMTPPLKILLVEDNPADAHSVQEMLQQVAVPFQLTHVTSLEAASAKLPGSNYLTTPAVVLLSLSFPDAQGLEAVKRVCIAHPHVPIVLMSDLNDEAIALQALQIGVQDYLIKGQTDAQLLLRAVRYAIERCARHRRELEQAQLALQQQTERHRLLAGIALRIRQSLQLDEILKTTVTEVRQVLQTDRVMIYRIATDQTGVLVAESVAPFWSVSQEIWERHCTWFNGSGFDWSERVWVVNDVYQDDFTPEYLQLMIDLRISALLVVPIIHSDNLWGLLAVHQCAKPRQWQPEEVDFLQELAIQVAIAIQQSQYQEVKVLNADLEIQVQQRTQQLTTEKALFKAILNSIQEAIVVMQPDGQVVLLNPAALQIYGPTLPKHQQQFQDSLSKLQIRNPDGSSPAVEDLPTSRALRGEVFTDHQLIIRCYNADKWVSICGGAVQDEAGRVQLAVTTTRNITPAKQALKALKQSEARFHRLSEVTSEGLMLHQQGEILDANQALARMFGYQDWEMIGRNSFEIALVTPESQELVRKNILSGYEKPYEAIGLRKDGSTFPIEIQGKVIPYQGRRTQVVAVRDITERKRTEAALIERDRLLEGVANATNHLLTTRDFTAAITLALSVLGLATNVDKVYIFEHIHPDTSEPLICQRFEWVRKTIKDQTNNPKLQNLLYKLLSHQWYSNLAAGKPLSGMVRDFSEFEREILEEMDILSILLVPILIEGGFWGFIVFEDCHLERQWTETEQAIIVAAASIGGAIARKRAEEALRHSEARFRAIFDSSGIGIELADLDGQIVDSNPALCTMLGYSREEQQCSLLAYTHPDDRTANLEFEELLAGVRDHYEMEKRFLHKDGRLVWSRLTVSLIQDSVGKSQFILSIIKDITAHKQAEIELRDSKEAAEAGSRAKSEFLATMSHELRTPLHAILGLSQLLAQELFGSLNAKQKEYLDCIHSSGQHLLELISDILDLSKVEAGKEELTLVAIDVQELCNDAVMIVRDRANEKDLQLTSEVDPQVDICIGDERRVKQMLLNLLTNAIKFTPAGRVSLRIQKVPQGIAFTVADTGIGIAPEQLKLLFQPFKQLDSQLNRQYAGTGLGLALTRKLARLHGGDVTVQSTLGEGSQFTLFLPYGSQESGVRSQETGDISQELEVRNQKARTTEESNTGENPSPGSCLLSPPLAF